MDAELAAAFESMNARLDDIVGMLSEAFDRMHVCDECVEANKINGALHPVVQPLMKLELLHLIPE